MNLSSYIVRALGTFYAERVFLATVVEVDGDAVRVQRTGYEPEAEAFAAADGLAATLTPGDLVKCQVVGARTVVEYRVAL